ncbi:MAG: hypothetical protein M4579_003187 [Chaenotheca gracillima]|nr:MAG: hypothetical protein M4579_003187 [Chaenotheca gracillima]
MLLHILLPVTLLLVDYSVCQQRSMSLWGADQGINNSPESSTWLSTTFVDGSEGQPNYQAVLDVARAHYNWLRDEAPDSIVRETRLVAVMWVPTSGIFFASTVPRGSYKALMLREGERLAPLWFNQVQSLVIGSTAQFHAEDSAYFSWESSADPEDKNQNGNAYPEGSLIAAWGKYPNDRNDREIPLCSTKRVPSCRTVARQLGVGYRGNIPQTAQEVQQDNDPNPYDGGISDADLLAIEGMCPTTTSTAVQGRRRARRDAGTSACNLFPLSIQTTSISLPASDFGSATAVITTGPMTTGPTTTPPGATPSCSMRNQDPDQGINSAYCVCDESITLPLQAAPTTAMETESCHYTTIPTTAHITTKPTLGPVTTDLKGCQVCTPVVNNEDSCSTIDGCIVKTGAVTVQAGSSPVHVGTLTGTQLYTSISNALETLCPSPTQTTGMTACSTDSVDIEDVPYVNAGFLSQGKLVVTVEASQYNMSSLRDAMIKSAALTAQNAATDKNCYDQKYDVESIIKRDVSPRWLPRIFRRDHPHAEQEIETWCNTVGFAGVNYYNPYWRAQPSPGATDYIDAHWTFETGPGGDFVCGLLEGLVDALAIVQPEFAVGDIELGEAIDVICEKEMSESEGG